MELLSLAMLLLGWHTRAASIATTFFFLLLCTWEFSLGKINHGILVVLAPLVLAGSGWGDALSVDAQRKTGASVADPGNLKGSWCVTLMAVVIGLAMFTAGWAKLTTGWLDWHSLATRGHLATNFYGTGRYTPTAEWLMATDSPLLWKLMDWGVVLLECGFLVAPVRRRVFRGFCAAACLFHVATWMTFDIQFFVNVIAYGVVVDWVGVWSWLTYRSPRDLLLGHIADAESDIARQGSASVQAVLGQLAAIARRCPPPLWLAVVGGPFWGLALLGSPPLPELLSVPMRMLILVVGAAIGAGYLTQLVVSRRRSALAVAD